MNEKIDEQKEVIDDTFSITMELQRPLFVDEEVEEIDNANNKKSNIKRNLLIAIVSAIVIGITGSAIWLSQSYEPQDAAKVALASDENIEVKIDEYISFTPKNIEPTKGFIFYPGAKVEPEAYAPFSRSIAEKGYEVIILDMPFNIALFGKNKAEKAIKDYSNISNWVVGGHSLGGVVASRFATENNMVDGVVLLASYPSNDNLKNMVKDVLSIWGSKDGVLNFDQLIKSREKLPKDTTYVEIEGANHSQFGDYGLQEGDNEALISSEKQMDIIYKNIVEFLERTN